MVRSGSCPTGAAETRRQRFVMRLPSLVALTTVAIGIVDVVSAITPEERQRLAALTKVLPLQVAHAASAATAVAGLLLIMLAHGLARRKRRAWRGALVLLLLSGVLNVAKGLDAEEASVALLLAALLIALSGHFRAASDPRTLRTAPLAFLGMLAASWLLGLGLLAARADELVGHPSLGDRLREVGMGLIGGNGPVRFRTDATSDVVFAILLALGSITLLVPTYLAIRAAEPKPSLPPDDERRLRDLLVRGDDSLGYFSLRRDKSVVVSSTGKAAISYRVVSGVMLATGDPIGDAEAWPLAIRRFVEIARSNAWIPAVIGCSERGGESWLRHGGLRALEIGDEGIVLVERFSLSGRSMRNVRQMVNRVERAGYVTRVRRIGTLTPDEIADIRRQASAWRGAEVERGFSMALGRFGEPGDEDCVVVTAHRDDRLAAVLHFVPWGGDGLSLDLMRRDRSADAGLNELMIVAALRSAGELGVTRVSLNFAMFRSALERGGRLGAGPVLRLWRQALLLASRWFQIDSLYRFNAKFDPVWVPRYLCYPRALHLPRITVAALEAEAFLLWPSQWWKHRRLNRSAPTTGQHRDDRPAGALTGR
ncbi:MAG: phosphatidylglycerol lysyltransferase domain-containing protein [Frankiaceae bacterium]